VRLCPKEEEDPRCFAVRPPPFLETLDLFLSLANIAENPLDLLGSVHPDPIRGFLQI
jgi:hypothetical protein